MSKCQCHDEGCPHHSGSYECGSLALVLLFRSDMFDITGTLMCDDCATDALASGVFTTHDRKVL